MENQNNENDNSQNIADETVNAEEETIETETQITPEELQTLKERAAKADELEEKNKKLFERAKKAEANKKEEKEVVSGLTPKDVLLLTNAGYTHEEDVDFVEKWAKFNKLEVGEAIKDNTLKTILATKLEERKTAQATATKGGARGVKEPSFDVILTEASRGKLPESESDIAKLAEARMAKRLEGK